jgi:RNA polymerase-binding transcription factor DksA
VAQSEKAIRILAKGAVTRIVLPPVCDENVIVRRRDNGNRVWGIKPFQRRRGRLDFHCDHGRVDVSQTQPARVAHHGSCGRCQQKCFHQGRWPATNRISRHAGSGITRYGKEHNMGTTRTATAQKRLREQQRELLEAIRTHLAVSGGDHLHMLANQHDATDDDAIADYLSEMDLATLAAELNTLREIQAARKRIADGTWGTCTQCGGDIAPKRLDAFPTAARCITCQADSETGRLRHNTM